MMLPSHFRSTMPVFLVALCAALAACGGGESSASDVQSIPLQADPSAQAQGIASNQIKHVGDLLAAKSVSLPAIGTATTLLRPDTDAVSAQSTSRGDVAAPKLAQASAPTTAPNNGQGSANLVTRDTGLPAVEPATPPASLPTLDLATTPPSPGDVVAVVQNTSLEAGAVSSVGQTSGTVSPLALGPPPPSLRQLFVEQTNPAASDANPGTKTAPLLTIGQAMKLLRPGDDVVIGPGTYREGVVVPTLAQTSVPTTIRARVPGSAVLKGSDAVAGWTRFSSDTWAIGWSGTEPEQVFRAGKPLKQIGGTVFGGYPLNPASPLNGMHASEGGIWPERVAGDKNALPLDSFTYQIDEKRVYVRLSTPLGQAEMLEVSTKSHVLFALGAHGLILRDLVFEHSNTSLTLRHGAVYVSGSSNIVRNITVRYMDAFCLMVSGDDSKILNSTVENCGQAGLAAYGSRVVVDRNLVLHNNNRGFNKNWEAGGMKLTGQPELLDAFVTNNVVAYNAGDGIWFDWTPKRITVTGNVTAYNRGHGIQYEASRDGIISKNLSYGNGLRGIYLLESSGTTVSGNSVFGNAFEGIAIGNGSRSASNPVLLPMGNLVLSNSIAWNDARRNRIQLMLPGLQFANVSDRNVVQATDVTPRYAEGWVSEANPYKQGLSAWRALRGNDIASEETHGPMPAELAASLAEQKILQNSALPAFLLSPGVK